MPTVGYKVASLLFAFHQQGNCLVKTKCLTCDFPDFGFDSYDLNDSGEDCCDFSNFIMIFVILGRILRILGRTLVILLVLVWILMTLMIPETFVVTFGISL